MTIVYGNLYKIEKKKVTLTGKNGQLKTHVVVGSESDSDAKAKGKTIGGGEETKDYHVANLEQEDVPMMQMTAQNLRLLPSDASLDDIESRLTSASLKKSKANAGGSG